MRNVKCPIIKQNDNVDNSTDEIGWEISNLPLETRNSLWHKIKSDYRLTDPELSSLQNEVFLTSRGSRFFLQRFVERMIFWWRFLFDIIVFVFASRISSRSLVCFLNLKRYFTFLGFSKWKQTQAWRWSWQWRIWNLEWTLESSFLAFAHQWYSQFLKWWKCCCLVTLFSLSLSLSLSLLLVNFFSLDVAFQQQPSMLQLPSVWPHWQTVPFNCFLLRPCVGFHLYIWIQREFHIQSLLSIIEHMRAETSAVQTMRLNATGTRSILFCLRLVLNLWILWTTLVWASHRPVWIEVLPVIWVGRTCFWDLFVRRYPLQSTANSSLMLLQYLQCVLLVYPTTARIRWSHSWIRLCVFLKFSRNILDEDVWGTRYRAILHLAICCAMAPEAMCTWWAKRKLWQIIRKEHLETIQLWRTWRRLIGTTGPLLMANCRISSLSMPLAARTVSLWILVCWTEPLAHSYCFTLVTWRSIHPDLLSRLSWWSFCLCWRPSCLEQRVRRFHCTMSSAISLHVVKSNAP